MATNPVPENSTILSNPLADQSVDSVLREAEKFRHDMRLRDKIPQDLLAKAAILARNPRAYCHFDNRLTVAARKDIGLNEREVEILEALVDESYPDDLQALKDEKDHKWRQPARLYFTIALCSIGAAVQGWDQTGTNGANLTFPEALGIPIDFKPHPPGPNDWKVGLINAAPYLSASLLGCWMADPINYALGRRGAIFIAAIFCFLAPLGSAFAQSWIQLLICRLILGIGMGIKATSIPVFAAENVPAVIRGALVMSWQTFVSFGIFLGFSANLAVSNSSKIRPWRLQVASALIPAIPLLIGVYACPESPRWYIKKREYAKAYDSLCRLRRTNLQATRDLYYIHVQLFGFRANEYSQMTTRRAKPLLGYLSRFRDLFVVPRIRRATLAAHTVMIAQQMCGINIIAFYSSSIFYSSGFPQINALWASWGFGLVNFFFAFPAILTIDIFGRRSLLLFTFPQMAWTLLAAGFSFKIPFNENDRVGGSSRAHVGLIAFFVFLFAAFYSPGEGPVPFTYSAEVFPLSHREMGMGFSVATNLFWAAVLSVTFPSLRAALHDTGTFGFYAGLNVLAFIMIFLFVPETKQRTLEDLDTEFKIPILAYMCYQVTEVLPYQVRRHVLRQSVRQTHLKEWLSSRESTAIQLTEQNVASDAI